MSELAPPQKSTKRPPYSGRAGRPVSSKRRPSHAAVSIVTGTYSGAWAAWQSQALLITAEQGVVTEGERRRQLEDAQGARGRRQEAEHEIRAREQDADKEVACDEGWDECTAEEAARLGCRQGRLANKQDVNVDFDAAREAWRCDKKVEVHRGHRTGWFNYRCTALTEAGHRCTRGAMVGRAGEQKMRI